ncbi:alpha-hydroxy acid oxidase [Noviherbaspirillum sp.]|uniref:alpha-hydroxy acid oxidase n=1 Tax=Noviherbaspirillum sp. TaxID=1926288 RepID=UPI002FE40650
MKSPFLTLSDFEEAAKRRLPPSIYGYISGGAGDEQSVRSNRAVFDRWSFIPRQLSVASERTQETNFWEQRYASPFGISPMGVMGLCCFDGDRKMARAARQAGLPFILSAASTTPLEQVVAEYPHLWFQAYLPSSREAMSAMLTRIRRAGIHTLVLTIDLPVVPLREAEIRNGFSVPFRPSFRLVAGGVSRPRWLIETFAQTLLRQGVPRLENLRAERGLPIVSRQAAPRAGSGALGWHDIEWVREQWPGKLILKGVLHPADARKAHGIGVDSLIVSNHGGRQLDGAIAPLDALLPVIEAVPKMPVMVDGGFRRGTDILKALALGASIVFLGRPLLYGLAVGGENGALSVLNILKHEIDTSLALLGCASMESISCDLLHLSYCPTTNNDVRSA